MSLFLDQTGVKHLFMEAFMFIEVDDRWLKLIMLDVMLPTLNDHPITGKAGFDGKDTIYSHFQGKV